jgi:hypothetical protein
MTPFKTLTPVKTLALAVALAMAGCAAAPTQAADAAHPTVVELFQSQGCSSCPPANANLLTVADRPDILALSFGVTYWDDLGWKDTFATPQYTARQRDYAHGLGHANVFTPQVVVNGRRDGVGADPRDFAGLIRAGERGLSGPAVTIGGGTVTVGAANAPAKAADVWLARYDPRIVQIAIKRGENGGKTLPHRNVVRELVRLGAWNGKAESLALPASRDPNLRTAILIQLPHGGSILAAAKG